MVHLKGEGCGRAAEIDGYDSAFQDFAGLGKFPLNPKKYNSCVIETMT